MDEGIALSLEALWLVILMFGTSSLCGVISSLAGHTFHTIFDDGFGACCEPIE